MVEEVHSELSLVHTHYPVWWDIPFIFAASSVIVLAYLIVGSLVKNEDIPSGIDSKARRFIDG